MYIFVYKLFLIWLHGKGTLHFAFHIGLDLTEFCLPMQSILANLQTSTVFLLASLGIFHYVLGVYEIELGRKCFWKLLISSPHPPPPVCCGAKWNISKEWEAASLLSNLSTLTWNGIQTFTLISHIFKNVLITWLFRGVDFSVSLFWAVPLCINNEIFIWGLEPEISCALGEGKFLDEMYLFYTEWNSSKRRKWDRGHAYTAS